MDKGLRGLERRAGNSSRDRMNYARALLRVGHRRDAAVQAGRAYSEDLNVEDAESLSLSYTGLLRIIHRKLDSRETTLESDGTELLVYEPDKEPLLFKSSVFGVNSIDNIRVLNTRIAGYVLLIREYASDPRFYNELKLDEKGIKDIGTISTDSPIFLVSPSGMVRRDTVDGSIQYNLNTGKCRLLIPDADYLDIWISDGKLFADNTGSRAKDFPFLKELAPNSRGKECKKVREGVIKVKIEGGKKYAISLPEPVRFLRENGNQVKKESDLLIHLQKTDSAGKRFSTTIEVPAIVLDNLRSYATERAGPDHGQIIE